ncbi:MBL fold metallo-hydrolase, partial [Deinococcus sp.]|uniref:MBL fold metallo-hydrolase n=1 Tax=Deinococcus sp. TaxID=47478 RepID=UPI0025BCACCB
VPTSAESQRLNKYDGPAIIMAGNGMMTGGRIQHHLKHNLWKPSTNLIIVSYQSPTSLGGRIVAGADSVRIMGEDIAVRAKVHTIGGFSAHADQDDLLAFLSTTGNPHVWLVHGEVGVMAEFVPVLAGKGLKGDIVPNHQTVELLGPGFKDGKPDGLVIPTAPRDVAKAEGGE